MPARWLKLSLRLPAAVVENAVAELWSLGTVGLEQHWTNGSCLIHAYFESSSLPTGVLESDAPFGSHLAGFEGLDAIEDRDWLEEYRRHSAPFPLGRRFVIDPREPGSPCGVMDDRMLLKLPARCAFGTGSHESTSLIVEWLEEQDLSGLSLLDVGTGTGILAFIALRLGAQDVVAIEIDPAAAFMAYLNQALNDARFPLIIGGVDALERSGGFDVIVVNVLPRRIARDIGRIANLVRPGGVALFSGLLHESSSEVSDRLQQVGFRVCGRRQSGEWGAVVVEREAK